MGVNTSEITDFSFSVQCSSFGLLSEQQINQNTHITANVTQDQTSSYCVLALMALHNRTTYNKLFVPAWGTTKPKTIKILRK